MLILFSSAVYSNGFLKIKYWSPSSKVFKKANFKDFTLHYVYKGPHVREFAHDSAHRSHKRAADPKELELSWPEPPQEYWSQTGIT